MTVPGVTQVFCTGLFASSHLLNCNRLNAMRKDMRQLVYCYIYNGPTNALVCINLLAPEFDI
jgi:hypothetical protein